MNLFATLPVTIENDYTVAEDIIFFLYNLDLFPHHSRIETVEEIGESIGLEKKFLEPINDYALRIIDKLTEHLKSNQNCAIIFRGFIRRRANVNKSNQRTAGQ